MSQELTADEVREAVKATVADIRDDCDTDTDRDDLIEAIDEHCDSLWGSLVRHGLIDQYDVDDLVATAHQCATIIRVAKDDSWVEDDHGLWEGLTYGVLASIAYFSLRNLLHEYLERDGIDVNQEMPFAVESSK